MMPQKHEEKKNGKVGTYLHEPARFMQNRGIGQQSATQACHNWGSLLN